MKQPLLAGARRRIAAVAWALPSVTATTTVALAAASLLAAFAAPAQAAVALAGSPAASAADEPIYAVVHVDIEPPDVPAALPILRRFEQLARQDPAVVKIDVLQQFEGSNHFTLVETLHSRDAFKQFVTRDYVKAMRAQLQPYLGSPFDERIHRAMPLTAPGASS